MWGDWSFNAKEKRVVKIRRQGGSTEGGPKSMFVQFALEPVWKVRQMTACARSSRGYDTYMLFIDLPVEITQDTVVAPVVL